MRCEPRTPGSILQICGTAALGQPATVPAGATLGRVWLADTLSWDVMGWRLAGPDARSRCLSHGSCRRTGTVDQQARCRLPAPPALTDRLVKLLPGRAAGCKWPRFPACRRSCVYSAHGAGTECLLLGPEPLMTTKPGVPGDPAEYGRCGPGGFIGVSRRWPFADRTVSLQFRNSYDVESERTDASAPGPLAKYK